MPAPIEELLRKRNEIDEVIRKDYSQQVTIIFTDIVGSTGYFAAKGDTAGRAMVQRHNDLLFPIIEEHHGQIIKTIGDAIMAGFDEARDGVRAAIRMQQRLAEHNQEADDEIHIRIGLHTGRAIKEPTDIYGDTVNTAARIEALADGDQILISGATAKEVENEQLNLHFHGNYPLKGLKEEIPIYEVLWDKDQKPKKPSPKAKKRIRISPIKMIFAVGLILFFGVMAIKFMTAGPIKKIEVRSHGIISVECYPPMDYYAGLPESLNLKVKEVFEKGQKYKQEYRFDEAIEEFKRCLKLKPIDEEKGALYILIGNCFYNKSKYKEAFSWYNKGMKITKKTGDRAGLATTYNNIGAILYYKSKYNDSFRWYNNCLDIS